MAHCLEDLADLARAAGLAERAARFFGAAAALREASAAPVHPDERVHYDRTVAAVRAALGDAAFTAAWGAGSSTAPDQLIVELQQS
jgi:hypothetical protein